MIERQEQDLADYPGLNHWLLVKLLITKSTKKLVFTILQRIRTLLAGQAQPESSTSHRPKEELLAPTTKEGTLTCRLGALRRHLSCLCFGSALLSTDHSLGIIPTVKALVERLVDGSVIHIGLVRLNKPDGSTYWHNTAVTNRRGNDYVKPQFAIQCLNIDDCIAIRIAKGVGSLPAEAGYSASVVAPPRVWEPLYLWIRLFGDSQHETLSSREIERGPYYPNPTPLRLQPRQAFTTRACYGLGTSEQF